MSTPVHGYQPRSHVKKREADQSMTNCDCRSATRKSTNPPRDGPHNGRLRPCAVSGPREAGHPGCPRGSGRPSAGAHRQARRPGPASPTARPAAHHASTRPPGPASSTSRGRPPMSPSRTTSRSTCAARIARPPCPGRAAVLLAHVPPTRPVSPFHGPSRRRARRPDRSAAASRSPPDHL